MYYPFARFNLIVPLQQEQRLRGTCFRGERKAGCFIKWKTAADVVLDPEVKPRLEEEVEDILDSSDFQAGDYSFTLELADWVGWDSTTSPEEVAGLQIERRSLNKRATALFVADPRFKARLTKLLTMIVKIQEDSRRPGDVAVLLESTYPGQDVGPLKGDVTAREGRIFLDWEQKGQSIPRSNPDETIPLGQCFSWAYRQQRENGGLLIHGSLLHPWDKKRFSHAWIERNGLVYDFQTAVKNELPKTIAEFYRVWKPTLVRTYRSEDAAIKLLKERHYGPWY